MGVRSSATCVETDDVKIVIDPAVALAPNRYGLAPHPVEERAKTELWGIIKDEVRDADVLVISHYHFDHVDPDEPELYSDKVALVKHPSRMINPSQKRRAASFLRSIKGIAKGVNFADGRIYRFGDTEIRFSKPVPHGSNIRRGYVVETCVSEDIKFLHTSDVQGPVLPEQVEFILEEGPEVVFCDGPTTYLDHPETRTEIRMANDNLQMILNMGSVKRLVLDHHLTRDLEYLSHIEPTLRVGKELGVSVQVAADFLDREPYFLEARRRELHGEEH